MIRVPSVKRGERITANLWNTMAGVVNEALAAPKDLDEGITSGEIGSVVLRELSRETVTERVTSPDDDEVYVDVAHITVVTVSNSHTGKTETTYFAGS